MSQKVHELLLAGRVLQTDFKAFVKAFIESSYVSHTSTATLLLLEQQPQSVVDPKQCQDLLLFSELHADIDIASYTSGRIFNGSGELRWEKLVTYIQVVYTGDTVYMPDLSNSKAENLSAYTPVTRKYILFGKKLDTGQLSQIHVARPGDFAEIRIPRLLRYPALRHLADAPYMKLSICEYIYPPTGANVAYRFKELVACNTPEEEKLA